MNLAVDLRDAADAFRASEVAGSADLAAQVGSLVGCLRWPLSLEAAAGACGVVVRAQMPPSNAPFVPTITTAGLGVAEELAVDGERFRCAALERRPGFGLLEGIADGPTELFFLDSSAVSERVCVRSLRAMERSDRDQQLWDRAAGGDARLLIRLSAIFELPVEAVRQARDPVEMLLGPEVTGLAVRWATDDGRPITEVYSDFSTNDGVVGPLLTADGGAASLLGWIPSTAREFIAGAVNVDAWARQVAGAPEIPLDRADWVNGVSDSMDLVLLALLEHHCDGRFAFAAPTPTPESLDYASVDADPELTLIGTHDGPALLATARDHCELRPAGEGRFDVLDEDGQALLRIAIRPGLLLIANHDAISLELLDAALATGGKGSPPRDLTARSGAALAEADLVFMGTRLGDLSGAMDLMEAIGHPVDCSSATRRATIAAIVDRGNPRNAGWIRVDEHGLIGRIVY